MHDLSRYVSNTREREADLAKELADIGPNWTVDHQQGDARCVRFEGLKIT